MSKTREPLFERLPEIYRIKDQEQARADRLSVEDDSVKGPLESYVEVLDEVLAAVHANIEDLYHDFFIETCDDWVVPYIADLLGTSHLSGDPWTVRADVARTVKNRRRKGTLGSIESLTFALTGWAVHTVEFRERMVWNQHLNHQRPDAGGVPPLTLRDSIHTAVRGGTVTLRDPALLSFLGRPFDPFARVADLKPALIGAPRVNLPNLGIFLWRLEDYELEVTQPFFEGIVPIPPAPGAAAFAVRFHLDPQGDPTVLFNTHRYRADAEPPNLADMDAVPGPMPAARLTEGSATGNPGAYVRVTTYSDPDAAVREEVGLTLHVPASAFPLTTWQIRGANLCAWEEGLRPPLRTNEVVIDPELGRVVLGVASDNPDGEALRDGLLASPTYGFSGPTGAHPIHRGPVPTSWQDQTPAEIAVNFHDNPNGLRDALADLGDRTTPLIIEINDSMTHDLDLSLVTGIGSEGGAPTLLLGRSLWIRAAAGQRPVIRMEQPLRFRPTDVAGPDAPAIMELLNVKLEGLYITRSPAFGATDALIEQAAVNRLTLDGCTLDPGGQLLLDGSATGSRQPSRAGMRLANDYGFSDGGEEDAFDQTPIIELYRTIAGPLEIDSDYVLLVTGSILDARGGDTPDALVVGAASGDANAEWGPRLTVDGMTAFGRMRVEEATGSGGIWLRRLEVHDNQKGCIRFSYVSGDGDQLPPNHALVEGPEADLSFASEVFGQPGYAQLRLRSDRRILEEGPDRDEMGAFGYLRNAHKWKNISIRYREFMPVGVRPILLPVT